MSKKKVVFITRRDYANMFYRLCTAINRYTEYEVMHVTKEANPKYGIQCQYCINFATDIEMRKIMKEIKTCDLAVVSDDFFRLEYMDNLPNKKIVYTGSSHYRRKHKELKEKYKNFGVEQVVISTPDLVLNGNEIYIPAPFDAINTGRCQKGLKDMMKKIVIAHICTNKSGPGGFGRKGHKIIKEIVEKLTKKYNYVEWKFITDKTNTEVLKEIRRIDILVESINGDTGVIGYSGIEAAAHEVCVITQKDNDMDNPIIYTNEYTLYNELEKLIKSPDLIKKHGKEQKVWCIKTHGYKAVAKKLERVFDKILGE